MAPVWVRVGGGFESIPEGARHGPVDTALAPPGGPWQPLFVGGELVGWADADGEGSAERARETGERLSRERRAHLFGRLDHKLRSSVLSLQVSARAAAYGRHELLEAVYDQAQEVSRRADALAAAALDPKEPARAVVLAASLPGGPEQSSSVPRDAIVLAPEPVLAEVMTRLGAWVGENAEVSAARVSRFWRLAFRGRRRQLDVPEFGEPLLRHLVEMQLHGWLDTSDADELVIYLPAAE